MEEYLIQYLPVIIEGVATGLLCWLFKKIGVAMTNVNNMKAHVLEKVENANTALVENTAATKEQISSLLSELSSTVTTLKDCQEDFEKLKAENEKLISSINKNDKRLIEIEALLRKE